MKNKVFLIVLTLTIFALQNKIYATDTNMVHFVDNSIYFLPFRFGTETAFGWDLTVKNDDQILSPDEILHFKIELEDKSGLLDSIEVLPELTYDPYLLEFYGIDYLENFSSTYSFVNQDYYTSKGICIPSAISVYYKMKIPYEFRNNGETVGRDTLIFKIQGKDRIPPIVFNPGLSSTLINVGEKLSFFSKIYETGDLASVTAKIKTDSETIVDEIPMTIYVQQNFVHYYLAEYTPSIESEFFIDIYAEDLAGNISSKIEINRFTSKDHEIKNDILLVYTYRTNFKERHLKHCSPYWKALNSKGYQYDIWDTYLRDSAVDSTILKKYDIVIYAADYFPDYFIPHLMSYLDNGGNLLVSSKYNPFSYIMQDTELLEKYMCTRFRSLVEYNKVEGHFGNGISEGLEIDLNRDDYYLEAIMPINNAYPLFNYNTMTTENSLSKKNLNKLTFPDITTNLKNIDSFQIKENHFNPWARDTVANSMFPPEINQVLQKQTDVNSSPVAAIAVDSTYRMVFLAFPFEAIEKEDDRAELMDRVMAWLGGNSPVNNNKELYNYKLGQNYPNPFNGITTIQYSLSRSAKVEMTLYNLKGQRVETLVNRHFQAGSYAVIWNAENYPSGVYFYQIEADNYVETKKCVYVK